MSIVSLDSDSHNQHVEATAFSVCHRHRGISRANVHTTDKSKVSTRAENKFESWFHLFRANYLVVQSNLKWASLICIRQSQRAFDCPITKDCYQHTPSVLVHGGRQQFYQKHNFYQEFGIRDRGFDLYQPTSRWLSVHQRLLSEHTPCVKLWQKTMWLSNERRLISPHTIYPADLPWHKWYHTWPLSVSFLFCTSDSQSGSASTTRERESRKIEEHFGG